MKITKISFEEVRSQDISERLKHFIRDNENISFFTIFDYSDKDEEYFGLSSEKEFGISISIDTTIIATTEPNARAKVIFFLSQT